MSGGFRTALSTESLGVEGDVPFLASQHLQVKRGGATFKADSGTDDGNGHSVIKKGTIVVPEMSTDTEPVPTGYYVPYAAGGTIPDDENGLAGFIMESIDVAGADVTEGILLHGSVLRARIPNLDATSEAAFAGRVTFQ